MVSNLERYAGTNCKQSSNYFIVCDSIFMMSKNISYARNDYKDLRFMSWCVGLIQWTVVEKFVNFDFGFMQSGIYVCSILATIKFDWKLLM